MNRKLMDYSPPDREADQKLIAVLRDSVSILRDSIEWHVEGKLSCRDLEGVLRRFDRMGEPTDDDFI